MKGRWQVDATSPFPNVGGKIEWDSYASGDSEIELFAIIPGIPTRSMSVGAGRSASGPPSACVYWSRDTLRRRVAVADPVRVRQIVRTLIVNARRHGGPSIEVTARQLDGEIEIAVCDDGPGIPEELRSAVFEPYTSSRAESGRTGSIGLGLNVSRRLARLMGGDVTLAPGDAGATFLLTLPAA